MSDFELIILLLRKNSRLLSEFINKTQNKDYKSQRRKKIIGLKSLIASTTNSNLYNIIKAMALNLKRFKVEVMESQWKGKTEYYSYYDYTSLQRIYHRGTNREFGKPQIEEVPLLVLDTDLTIRFIVDTKHVFSDDLVLFEQTERDIFRGVASAILDAKKREEQAQREAEELIKEQEKQLRKERILAKYN